MSSRKFNTKRNNEIPEVGTHHNGSASVYMMHKITKLREIITSDLKIESQIFASCIIFINGVTNPPVEELRRLISIHGGECVNYRVSGLTHFVCDYFTDAQLKHEYSKKRIHNGGSIYNVRAQWIIDSIKESRRLDEIQYLPKGLQEQFGRPITSHFVKAANVADSASTKNSLSYSGSRSSSSSSSSSSSGCASSSSSGSSSSNSGSSNGSGSTSSGISRSGNSNTSIHDKYTIDAAACSSSTATATMTATYNAQDSPSAMGLTLSQEDFIRSVPLEELHDDIFEQLIQHNLSRRAAKFDTGSIGTAAASLKRAVDDVIAIPQQQQQQQHPKKELQEMVRWIHRGNGSAEVAMRLLSYIDQLIQSFSGYKNRHPDDREERGLCLPDEFHYDVLQSYGVWLLSNHQFDNLAMFIRQLRKVCRTVTTTTTTTTTTTSTAGAAAESLSGNQSYCEWQKQWSRVPLRVEEHIQKRVASRFKCQLIL